MSHPRAMTPRPQTDSGGSARHMTAFAYRPQSRENRPRSRPFWCFAGPIRRVQISSSAPSKPLESLRISGLLLFRCLPCVVTAPPSRLHPVAGRSSSLTASRRACGDTGATESGTVPSFICRQACPCPISTDCPRAGLASKPTAKASQQGFGGQIVAHGHEIEKA